MTRETVTKKLKNSHIRPSQIQVDENGDLSEETEKELLNAIHNSIIPLLHENEGDVLQRLSRQYIVYKKRIGELNDEIGEFAEENDVSICNLSNIFNLEIL